MPTVYREGPYRFFFNSREEPRMHIHVAAPDGLAKFWLEPIVALASSHAMLSSDLKTVETIVRDHEQEFKDAWNRHFGQ